MTRSSTPTLRAPPTRRTSGSSLQPSKTPSCSSTSRSTTLSEEGKASDPRKQARDLQTHTHTKSHNLSTNNKYSAVQTQISFALYFSTPTLCFLNMPFQLYNCFVILWFAPLAQTLTSDAISTLVPPSLFGNCDPWVLLRHFFTLHYHRCL